MTQGLCSTGTCEVAFELHQLLISCIVMCCLQIKTRRHHTIKVGIKILYIDMLENVTLVDAYVRIIIYYVGMRM